MIYTGRDDAETAASRQSDRAFGIMFAIVFAVISILGWLFSGRLIPWAGGVAAGFLLIALVCPGVLLPLNRLWRALAHRLGTFNNFVILSVIFYVAVVPFGVVMRLLGRDSMNRRTAKPDTYFQPVAERVNSNAFRDMF